MVPISVVMISQNEGHIIEKTFKSIEGLTDDIILVDSGSTDDTLAIAKKYKATIIKSPWYGYGKNKNIGISKSKYHWILSLDADEVIDEQLFKTLTHKTFFNENIIYRFRFSVLIGNVRLKYGCGTIKKIRIFNKKKAKWNNDLLHESLVYNDKMKIEELKGNVHHYSYRNINHYMQKMQNYTTLSAGQMHLKNKKATFTKIYINPVYSFIINYIFRFGFLDGFWGFTFAKISTYSSFFKYIKLKELNDIGINYNTPTKMQHETSSHPKKGPATLDKKTYC